MSSVCNAIISVDLSYICLANR